MSLTNRVLLGLLTGFGLGLALAGSSSPAVSTALAVMATVGTIFINLIRMTVIPLVASMLIASVGSLASSGALGRAGARAAIVAVAMLALTAVGDGADRDAGAGTDPDRSGRGDGAARPIDQLDCLRRPGVRSRAGAMVHRPRVAERGEGRG